MLQKIENEEQYEATLSTVYVLMQKKLNVNSAEFNELNRLSKLVNEYEMIHYSIQNPSENVFTSEGDLIKEIKRRNEAFLRGEIGLTSREELIERIDTLRNTL